MIVKFHARGVGRGSGPVDYLLGPQRDREGATLDRGDPGLIEALIDSSPYAKKYTSGVLSFQEAGPSRRPGGSGVSHSHRPFQRHHPGYPHIAPSQQY